MSWNNHGSTKDAAAQCLLREGAVGEARGFWGPSAFQGEVSGNENTRGKGQHRILMSLVHATVRSHEWS